MVQLMIMTDDQRTKCQEEKAADAARGSLLSHPHYLPFETRFIASRRSDQRIGCATDDDLREDE